MGLRWLPANPAPHQTRCDAAKKVILAVELPPRHVQVHAAGTMRIVGWHLLQLRKISARGTADGVGEIPPYCAGGIGAPLIGEQRLITDIEQQARNSQALAATMNALA